MSKLTKQFKTFKFPLNLNAYRKKDQLNSNNHETCSFASSFLFQNAYNSGLIPTYFIADRELIHFFISSFKNSNKDILNDVYAKRLNYQNMSMHKEILPQISGVLTFPENMRYSPILYFIEYSISDKKIQFGIEINKAPLTFFDYSEIDLIPEMTPNDKKYINLLLGFLLYKEVFPLSVKNGLLWNIPKFSGSKKKYISLVADKKVREVFKKRNGSSTPYLMVGKYEKLTTKNKNKKCGQIVYTPPTFKKG